MEKYIFSIEVVDWIYIVPYTVLWLTVLVYFGARVFRRMLKAEIAELRRALRGEPEAEISNGTASGKKVRKQKGDGKGGRDPVDWEIADGGEEQAMLDSEMWEKVNE